ncbi:type III-B CRISPR-associated protein Cas10/Cmr2 [Candidatus Chlorohelix sp.]|uniref:type III-B CRISPR-associated protein Cas10/Cmr2 n=1 Tax=Candidatus Chlorohelix sp. TaxID=3139201 RepID=UPI0030694972
MTQQALLLVSIGPVQDFIAGARTIRDLWAGSYVLSFLAQKAHSVSLEAGAKPVYPAQTSSSGLGLSASFPNKFIVRVDFNRAEELGNLAENSVRQGWKDIANSVKEMLGNYPDKNVWTGWDAQIENLLEIYWVCISLPSAQNLNEVAIDYKTFAELNLMLDGRKKLRDFESYQGDAREKDTLDGFYEQMGPVNSSRAATAEFWNKLGDWLAKQGTIARVAENERLSAINLNKRFAWDCYFRYLDLSVENFSLPSTSDIATIAWKQAVSKIAYANSVVNEAKNRFIAALQPFLKEINEPGQYNTFEKIDGMYFYPESLDESSGNLARWSPLARDSARHARPLLKAFFAEIAKIDSSVASPSRYYGILKLDGDNMGKILSGEEVVSGKPPRKPEVISQLLLKYTQDITKIAADFNGIVVYSGGDDALLLLPVATILTCAQKLKEAFPLDETTISMGAAIAHHKQPLQTALQAARLAEETSKERFGRGALTLSVLKRSGEELSAGCNWTVEVQENGELFEAFETLNEFIQQLRLGAVSPRLPHNLYRETVRLYEDKGESVIGSTEILKSEFIRLFKRHCEVSELDKLRDKLAVRLLQGDFGNFCNLLLVATFLARGGAEE